MCEISMEHFFFSFLFFFWQYWGLNLSHSLHQPFLCDIFEIGSCRTIWPGWLRTVIPLIFATWVARIYRHEPPAPSKVLFILYLGRGKEREGSWCGEAWKVRRRESSPECPRLYQLALSLQLTSYPLSKQTVLYFSQIISYHQVEDLWVKV
jgi:hypothetical protein